MELLRDRSEDFAEAGVHPYGISRDSAWTHIAWMQALDLNFPLLSDWNAEAVHGFGVTQDFRGLRDVAGGEALRVELHGRRRARPRRGGARRPPADALPPLARRAPGRARRRALARPVQLPAGVEPDDQLRRLALRPALLAARRRARPHPRLERVPAPDLPRRRWA